jgi:hypothetical protein
VDGVGALGDDRGEGSSADESQGPEAQGGGGVEGTCGRGLPDGGRQGARLFL